MADPTPLSRLIDVMARLRDPETGCPWDLAQDFSTIIPHTIEEAFEVADALDRGDMPGFQDELGDLLLQVVFQAQIAKDKGLFTIDDVADGIAEKLVRRHPHVFGDEKAQTPGDVNVIWDAEKAKEKGPQDSVLDGVTRGLPALLRSDKLQKRAAKVGFEWEKPEDVLDKLDEEARELREALNSRDINHIHEELGDVLFVLVNFARMLDLQAEEALRQANAKFERRFRGMETEIRRAGRDFSALTLDEMNEYWNEQKRIEKKEKAA